MVSYGSVCSGIEAAGAAWLPLGFRCEWLAEVAPFPCAVLAHHYPETPNLGDMTGLVRRVLSGAIAAPDVLIGGTPCQAFSVAGMREGLADPRGLLTIRYVELADAIDAIRRRAGKPETVAVWENVPGVLSVKGNAFGCFLAALVGESEELETGGGKWPDAGCVYGPTRAAAWRVLDAQYFGLAQRRRRVFVVASARSGFHPESVLFEREGVRRDTPPRRDAGAKIAATLDASFSRLQGCSGQDANHGHSHLVAYGGGNQFDPIDTAGALLSHGLRGDYESETFCVHGTMDPDTLTDLAHTLGRNGGQENAALFKSRVRRLTPRECERLMGFPDDYTAIPYRGKPASQCPDGPRYEAIGNSKPVPVVAWLGRRLLRALELQIQGATP